MFGPTRPTMQRHIPADKDIQRFTFLNFSQFSSHSSTSIIYSYFKSEIITW